MANDSILPQPDVLNEAEYGKFVLANLAAKRAKQIKEGAPPLVRIDSSHPLTIALAEIAQGKIKPLLGEEAEAAMAEQLESIDELSTDRFLLPGLDDEEGLVVDLEGDEDSHDDEETAGGGSSLLTELLGDDDLEEDAVEEEDGEISLDDLAKQEEEEEEEPAED